MNSQEKLIEFYRLQYRQSNPTATDEQFRQDYPEYKRRHLLTVGMSMADRQLVVSQPRSEWSTLPLGMTAEGIRRLSSELSA